jgi:hypothetical protein
LIAVRTFKPFVFFAFVVFFVMLTSGSLLRVTDPSATTVPLRRHG